MKDIRAKRRLSCLQNTRKALHALDEFVLEAKIRPGAVLPGQIIPFA